jgi:uncharacterized protein
MGNASGQQPSESTQVAKSPLRERRLPLHVFEMERRNIVFDPESGKFFRTDKIATDILARLSRLGVSDRSMEVITDQLRGKYAPDAFRQAQDEISGLIRSGDLFANPLEIERPKSEPVKLRLVSVTLNVVSSCNLDCIYCWNKGGTYGRVKKEKRMTSETARRAVDLMVEHSIEDTDLLVDFYGGEPLLNFDVIRNTIDYCQDMQSKSKKKFTYKVTTNGTTLTEEMVDYFDTIGGVTLGISIDGTKRTHNRNRPFRSGRGTWDSIQKNLEAASLSNNTHVSARATLVPPDLDMVKATKGLFRLGFYDTEVEFASEACEAFNPNAILKYSDDEVEKMKREYLKFAKFYVKYSLYGDEAIDVGISNNITRVLHQSHRFSPCGAGSNFVCVTEEGDLYPCMGFIGMKDYRLGDVSSGVDLEILEKFRHKMRSVIHEAEECADCWARHICAGNCPANNEQHNQEIFKPYKRGCEWLKFQLEVAMWVASEMSSTKVSSLEGYEPV